MATKGNQKTTSMGKSSTDSKHTFSTYSGDNAKLLDNFALVSLPPEQQQTKRHE